MDSSGQADAAAGHARWLGHVDRAQAVEAGLGSSDAVAGGPSSQRIAGVPALTESRHGSQPEIFLFIGILSGAGQEQRRAAVREAWSQAAQQPGQVAARFVLSQWERSPAVDAEQAQHGDIIFLSERTNYSTIGLKTYHILEYAVSAFRPAFVLKTDDDAYVNVPALLPALRALCVTPGCRGQERLYIGAELRNSSVVTEPGHRWNNEAFVNHTGLSVYPSYMGGGGYVLSADLAAALVKLHTQVAPLKHTTAEDVTLAMWLLPCDGVRRVDHPGFRTQAGHCCAHEIERQRMIVFLPRSQAANTTNAARLPTTPELPLEDRLQLTEEAVGRLCGPNPWLVVHKLEPDWIRLVGRHVARCPTVPASQAELEAS
ncbi:hypothetical protein ABPG77_002173 [Micractinium sp. CCAP 211/92]